MHQGLQLDKDVLADPLGSVFLLCSMVKKSKKKSPPAGKFGLVFGLLGFEVLVFEKLAVSPAFWAILTESESCLFLS